MIPVTVDGVEFAMDMKALASLEKSFDALGLEKIMSTVIDGGHSKMVIALAAMSGKPAEYFGTWSMKETQDVFMKALNMSLYGTEEAPEPDPLEDETK